MHHIIGSPFICLCLCIYLCICLCICISFRIWIADIVGFQKYMVWGVPEATRQCFSSSSWRGKNCSGRVDGRKSKALNCGLKIRSCKFFDKFHICLSPSSLLLFNKFRNGEVCEWCFSPSKEIFFSSDIRIYIADFKITRICLVNSLYFSFTVEKKNFLHTICLLTIKVYSVQNPSPLSTSPPLHISTGHHSSIEAEIAPQCRSIHAATTPKPTITFKLKHFSTVYLIAHTPQ